MAAAGACYSCGVIHFESTAILFFRAHAQGLVFAGIEFTKECGQAVIEFSHDLIATDIDVVILYCAPQTLDHDVFQSASFAVHAGLNLMVFECAG